MHIDAAETSEITTKSTEINRTSQPETISGMRDAVLEQVDKAVSDVVIQEMFYERVAHADQKRRKILSGQQAFIGTGKFRRRFNGLGIEVGGAKANFDPAAIFQSEGI